MGHSSTTHSNKRAKLASLVLLVFVAYLIYLPIHAISGEHCLPGISHIEVQYGDACDRLCESAECELATGADRGCDLPGEGAHHHHHSAEDHEVESTAKDGAQELVLSLSTELPFRVLEPSELAFAALFDDEVRVVSFSPGQWLISRGPPLA